MNNPWLNISWNNTIADCDKDFPVLVGKKEFKFGSKDYIEKINEKDPKEDFDNDKTNKKRKLDLFLIVYQNHFMEILKVRCICWE